MDKNRLTGIYKITSPSGKIYIGQSKNILKRFEQYRRLANCRGQKKLYNSLLKHGVENHIYEIVLQCELKELNDKEVLYIELNNSFDTDNGLNLTSGGRYRTKLSRDSVEKIRLSSKGNKNRLGKPKSLSEIDKIKNTMIGRKYSQERIDNMSKAGRGRIVSQEVRDKMSKSRKGRATWNKGIPMSEEAKNKLRGLKRTSETKLKQSISHKGKSAWNKGRIMSDEFKKKISTISIGRIVTQQTRDKISKSLKIRHNNKHE